MRYQQELSTTLDPTIPQQKPQLQDHHLRNRKAAGSYSRVLLVSSPSVVVIYKEILCTFC